MKELYISPELELICFVAEEKLASDVDFGGIGEGGNLNDDGNGISNDSDIQLPGIPGGDRRFSGRE